VTDEQHTEFFRRITGSDEQTPLARIHVSVDAPVQYHALLYVPEKAPLEVFVRGARGVRLYAKRVLIMEECEQLVPQYLRFLRGVVDSEDLSLNVSREMLQDDKTLEQIQQQITKQVLRALKDLAESDPEKYERLWSEFGRIVKEGITTDWRNKDAIADLCRFESMRTEPGKHISLRQYVAAMPESQREIYYVTGLGRRAVEESPHLEAFRRRGLDVLFFVDPVDEWVARSLGEYDKRRLRSIAHGEIDLGPEPGAPEGESAAMPAEAEAAVAAVKEVLGDRVKDVRASKRLTDSASCLVAAEGDPGANMERILEMLDKKPGERRKRILELNPTHPIVRNLGALATREPGSDRVKAWAELLHDQALLAEGIVHEPAKLVRRIQDLLTELSSTTVGKG
jgi:molecular chaperone HtpG